MPELLNPLLADEPVPGPVVIVPVGTPVVFEDVVILIDWVGRLPVAVDGAVWPLGPPVEFDKGNGG